MTSGIQIFLGKKTKSNKHKENYTLKMDFTEALFKSVL